MAALTVDFRKHSVPTPADVTAPQIITDCGNFTLDFKQLGFYASLVFLQTVISKWNDKFTFIFGPLSNSPVLFQHISLPNFFLSVNFAFNMLWLLAAFWGPVLISLLVCLLPSSMSPSLPLLFPPPLKNLSSSLCLRTVNPLAWMTIVQLPSHRQSWRFLRDS